MWTSSNSTQVISRAIKLIVMIILIMLGTAIITMGNDGSLQNIVSDHLENHVEWFGNQLKAIGLINNVTSFKKTIIKYITNVVSFLGFVMLIVGCCYIIISCLLQDNE
ncbi:hypothetical protein N186_08045 [Thermofilum adornatum]|uniref:Uncharacterized protein n=1 Tax=Thermofilum adornatum TaxID=1365176 RepID=S6A5Z7_9CREN|nr:hypothetical protein N186_08045 [Thermofilum adornatum]